MLTRFIGSDASLARLVFFLQWDGLHYCKTIANNESIPAVIKRKRFTWEVIMGESARLLCSQNHGPHQIIIYILVMGDVMYTETWACPPSLVLDHYSMVYGDFYC